MDGAGDQGCSVGDVGQSAFDGSPSTGGTLLMPVLVACRQHTEIQGSMAMRIAGLI